MADPWEQQTPLRKRGLQDAHREILEGQSGISNFIVEARGYYSPRKKAMQALVEQKVYPEVVLKAKSWIAIPIWRPDGNKHCEVVRLIDYAGKLKYLWPIGYRNALDVHPLMMEYVLDKEAFLMFVEGVKKADSILTASFNEDLTCVPVAVNGCDGWKGKTSAGSVPLPDFLDIPLAKRRAYTVSDSDWRTNPNVFRGWNACVDYLSSKTGASHSLLLVTPPTGLAKQGADDYLTGGGTLTSLLGFAGLPKVVLLDAPLEESVSLDVKPVTELFDRAGDKVPHLLDPLLPERSIVVLAGHSGTLKSWHAMGLMLEAAFQQTWLNHPSLGEMEKPFKSMYINKEMPPAMFDFRWKQLLRNPKYQNIADWRDVVTNSVFAPDNLGDFNLVDQKHRDNLEDAIVEYGISLVVLDSLSMCWSGNENDNSEVGVLYSQLRGISDRTNVSWIVIHHTNKPGSNAKKEHQMFSVRGAGQIVNQADSAAVLTRHEDRETDKRAIKLALVKTRTNREPPSFISVLEDHDGFYISITFAGEVSTNAAEAYATSKRTNPQALQEYVLATLRTFPALKASGMRTPQLLAMLRSSWPEEMGSAPSDSSLRKALENLVAANSVLRSDSNQRLGDLFVLPELEGLEEDNTGEESSEEHQPAQPKARANGKDSRHADASSIIHQILEGDDE